MNEREEGFKDTRKVLLTDITYIFYGNAKRAYLPSIMDVFTKQILPYVLSDSLEIDFVLETVNILIRDHGVSLSQETLIHSDQGCHHTSIKFQKLILKKLDNLCLEGGTVGITRHKNLSLDI